MSAGQLWRTKSGVLIREAGRRRERNRRGEMEIKIFGERVPIGGAHGWLWLRNLTPVEDA